MNEAIKVGEKLISMFDAVVMLTASNWNTEPRSNRYHYATRFARYLPVLFLQTKSDQFSSLIVQPTELPGIEIANVPEFPDERLVDNLLALLRARGIRKPLVWGYYSPAFVRIVDSMSNAFVVFHATEDYLTHSDCWQIDIEEVQDNLRHILLHVHLLIAVSKGVLESFCEKARWRGSVLLAENGCDAEFFLKLVSQQNVYTPTESKTAIYQGAINRRLDYELLFELVRLLPDWNFWFCGEADEGLVKWYKLKNQPNVRHFGKLTPEEVGFAMCQATVGIIPFIQDQLIRNSLPLKAYEYVACGLPVVTVPIDSLASRKELFTFESTASGFAASMRRLAGGRFDATLLTIRKEAALKNSYEERFKMVVEAISNESQLRRQKPQRLNIAILYDDASNFTPTITEHLESFRKYSHNVVNYVSVTNKWTTPKNESPKIDLSIYDVLIVHYGVRLSLPDHLLDGFAVQIERHRGLKILFIQDEYDLTETARQWMERLQFDIVYTCIPKEYVESVYPKYRFPATDFLQTLTGFVPEQLEIESYAVPMNNRRRLIGYRGRKLPFFYGTLAHEKYRIGIDIRKMAMERGLDVDIEVDDCHRIYGSDWYSFLGSCRATLGTESGSNIFDYDGSISREVKRLLKETPAMTFGEVHEKTLAPHEGHVIMNQVSPKIFEAIRLRTALILFEGSYSGVVQPHEHFIALRKDYSNVEDVFKKVQDISYLESLTERAYTDVIDSGKYSYERFIRGVDSDIQARGIRGARYDLYLAPVLARGRDGSVRAVLPNQPSGFIPMSRPLGGTLQRDGVEDLVKNPLNKNSASRPTYSRSLLDFKMSFNSRLRRLVGRFIVSIYDSLLTQTIHPETRKSIVYVMARGIWRRLPNTLRTRIEELLRK